MEYFNLAKAVVTLVIALVAILEECKGNTMKAILYMCWAIFLNV